MVNVLKTDDLTAIEQFFQSGGYDNENIEVVNYIRTQERLNKLDREFFYKTNPPTAAYEQKDVSEIKINVGGVTFRYVLRLDKDEDGK